MSKAVLERFDRHDINLAKPEAPPHLAVAEEMRGSLKLRSDGRNIAAIRPFATICRTEPTQKETHRVRPETKLG